MRTSTRLFTALGVAGVIVAAGTAFTATSTIDESQKIVGSTSQTISGVSVSSVQYTTDAADLTTAVTFHVAEDLATTPATIAATIGNGTTTIVDDDCQQTPVPASADSSVPASTDVTCTFGAGITNVTRLDIAAS